MLSALQFVGYQVSLYLPAILIMGTIAYILLVKGVQVLKQRAANKKLLAAYYVLAILFYVFFLYTALEIFLLNPPLIFVLSAAIILIMSAMMINEYMNEAVQAMIQY